MNKTESAVVSEAVSAYVSGEKIRAAEVCDRGIRDYPELAPLLHLRGVLHFEGSDLRSAVTFLERAVASKGDVAEYYNSLGIVFNRLGENEKSLAAYQAAMGICPNFAEASNNLGDLLAGEGKLGEAETYFRRALSFKRDYTDALYNLGNVLKRLGRLQEALDSFETCLRLDPSYGESAWNRGLTNLLMGNFAKGWPDYERRFSQVGFPPRRTNIKSPLWEGESLMDRRILVYCEQGYGDIIQFMRFLPLLVRRGADVTLECPPRLKCLLSNLNFPLRTVTTSAEAGAVDYHLPLLSLAMRCDENLDVLEDESPYLSIPDSICERVNARFSDRLTKGRMRVGIQWQGDPGYYADKERSIPLNCWEALLSIKDVEWISLQKGDGVDELEGYPSVLNFGKELDEGSDGFMETAALMQELDLIISSDTAVVHLAGALGRPAWVLLGEHPDWRWGLQGTTSPWYKSLALFRQADRGDWEGLMSVVRAALSNTLEAR